MVEENEFPDILQKSSLASMASRSASETSATPPFFLQRVTPCALQRVTLAPPKVEGTPSCVEVLD